MVRTVPKHSKGCEVAVWEAYSAWSWKVEGAVDTQREADVLGRKKFSNKLSCLLGPRAEGGRGPLQVPGKGLQTGGPTPQAEHTVGKEGGVSAGLGTAQTVVLFVLIRD